MSWTDWLSRHYMTDVPASMQSDAGGAQTFSSVWVGVGGIWPGTGSGNEPTESVHAAWQRQLEALGGRVHVTEALRTMENLYEKWCSYYDWANVTALRTLPPQVDPSHMHGDVLAGAGRSTGLKYVAAHAANPSLVLHNPCELRGTGHILAMLRSLEGTSPIVLDAAAAQRSLDLLQAKPAEVKSLLEHAGILQPVQASVSRLNHHFQDIVHVWRKTGPGVPDLCSCRAFTLHAGCEHVVFSASLELPGCEPQSSVSPAVEFCLARISARPCVCASVSVCVCARGAQQV